MYFKRLIATTMIALAIASCASSTAQYQPPESFDNFTTDGKLTKTVETPWGDKQVYDPTQDPEVIAAFEYVKTLNNRDSSKTSKETLELYKRLFSEIRGAQFADMLRLGCLQPIYDGCGGRPKYVDNKIHRYCPTPKFGDWRLDTCELKNIKIDVDEPVDPVPLGAPDNCRGNFSSIQNQKAITDFFLTGCQTFDINYKAKRE